MMFATATAVMMVIMIIVTCAVLEGLRDMCVAFWDWQGGSGTLTPVVLVIFNVNKTQYDCAQLAILDMIALLFGCCTCI